MNRPETAATFADLTLAAQQRLAAASLRFERALSSTGALETDVARWAVTETTALIALADGRVMADRGGGVVWLVDAPAERAVAYDLNGRQVQSGTFPAGLAEAVALADPTTN